MESRNKTEEFGRYTYHDASHGTEKTELPRRQMSEHNVVYVPVAEKWR